MFKGFPPGASEQDPFQELKAGQCVRMAEAMGRRETWVRELGCDKSMQGLETVLEAGLSLKRNDKPLKVGTRGITRRTF